MYSSHTTYVPAKILCCIPLYGIRTITIFNPRVEFTAQPLLHARYFVMAKENEINFHSWSANVRKHFLLNILSYKFRSNVQMLARFTQRKLKLKGVGYKFYISSDGNYIFINAGRSHYTILRRPYESLLFFG